MRRFRHIVQEVLCSNWLITEQAHCAIQAILASRLGMTAQEWQAAKREGTDISGNEVDLPQMTIKDGVAEIPVAGVILQGAAPWEKGSGAVSTEDIEADLVEAMSDDRCKGIFLDFDSPGGSVGGIPELGDLVAQINAKKPVMSYINGGMDSGALWLGIGAGEIVARDRMTSVGSIGVYMPWMDRTEEFAQKGRKVELIVNEGADLKGMGYPGTSLSKSQREHLQERANKIGVMFRDHVEKHRGPMDDNLFRGQSFDAEDVVGDLVDSIAPRAVALAEFKGTLGT